MTIEEKVGQVFLAPVFRENPDAFLEETKLGNVILFQFANGLHSFDQVQTLCTHLKGKITQVTGISPLIAVDQEGGRVQQLKHGFTSIPTPHEMQVQDRVREMGRIVGQELLSAGVTTNLAPVVDIVTDKSNPIGERAFCGDSACVVGCAEQYIDGLHESGIHAVLKHFPGLGETDVDSHLDLPVLDNIQLEPFEALKGKADAIMVGHAFVPQYDPLFCTSLSPAIVTDILRKQLHFEKVVICDSLMMNGVLRKVNTFEEAVARVSRAAIQAFKAGSDLLILSKLEWASFTTTIEQDEELIIRVMDNFKRAVLNKEISEERLNLSLLRIKLMKERRYK